MTHINFKVIDLTRPGFKATNVGLEPMIFGFIDLPEREVGALLIQAPRLVRQNNHEVNIIIMEQALPVLHMLFEPATLTTLPAGWQVQTIALMLHAAR